MSAQRCDRCNVAAKQKVIIHTRAELGDMELLFCQHHYNEHVVRLGELVLAGTVTITPLDAAPIS